MNRKGNYARHWTTITQSKKQALEIPLGLGQESHWHHHPVSETHQDEQHAPVYADPYGQLYLCVHMLVHLHWNYFWFNLDIGTSSSLPSTDLVTLAVCTTLFCRSRHYLEGIYEIVLPIFWVLLKFSLSLSQSTWKNKIEVVRAPSSSNTVSPTARH